MHSCRNAKVVSHRLFWLKPGVTSVLLIFVKPTGGSIFKLRLYFGNSGSILLVFKRLYFIDPNGGLGLCSVRIYFRTAGPRPLWPSRAERLNSMRSGLGPRTHFFVRSLVEESKIFQKANRCVFTDSNVGQSIASRFSASRKTKHVELRFLYVQELVASGMVRIKKVLGKLNPADILTKYIAKDTLHRHLPTFGFAMRFSHPPLRVCGLPLFPRRTQTRKKMTLRVERTTFLRTCPFHACTDMYFCLCSSTCLRLSLVLGIFRFSRNQL